MFLPFTTPQENKYKDFENCPRCPSLVKIPLKNEIWKRHKESNLLVSNLGRVANSQNNIPTPNEILTQFEQNPDKTGYLVVEKSKKPIYRLVAETFKPMPSYDGYDCHHIDNNGTNNTPDNLIWLKTEHHKQTHN